MKNLLNASLEGPSTNGQDLAGVTVDYHGHISVAFSDGGFVYQQHPTPLTASPSLYET